MSALSSFPAATAGAGAPGLAAAAAFAAGDEGVVALRAPLTFATVNALHAPGVAYIEAAGKSLTLDLQAVTRVDSAGLALLIDWLAFARAHGCQLHYRHASDALLALARLSEVEPLLSA